MSARDGVKNLFFVFAGSVEIVGGNDGWRWPLPLRGSEVGGIRGGGGGEREGEGERGEEGRRSCVYAMKPIAPGERTDKSIGVNGESRCDAVSVGSVVDDKAAV